eukprot:gene5745-5985_t
MAAICSDDKRWEGVSRVYTKQDVDKLRGSVKIEHTLARLGAERLWKLLHSEPYINALGALTGNQAVQQVQAGLKAIYLSGWQVAGDANTAMQTYPDQSLYPADSVPKVVERINNAFQRADQIQHVAGKSDIHWFAPIFVTLAGFHALNFSMFTLAHDYAKRGMAAYAELQAAEFAAEKQGYTATRHQGFVGTGYFDELAQAIASGQSSTTALHGSTEEEQF